MESISREDVPAYLRRGTLFQNLDSSDKERFEIPSDCFKKEPKVANIADLSFVIRSARFWGLDDLPFTVVSYLVKNGLTLQSGGEALIADFPEYRTFLTSVLQVGQQEKENVIVAAISTGLGAAVVKHLHSQDRYPLSREAYIAAAEKDDLPLLVYMHRHSCVWIRTAIQSILSHGSVKCFKYAMSLVRFDTSGFLTCAVSYNQLELARCMLDMGIPPEASAMTDALHRGNLEAFRILLEAGCAWPEDAAHMCVTRINLDCLTYAHENGCPLPPHLCTVAARYGHLHCLEYAHLHGCVLNENTLSNAAMNNQLECLRYAHQHGGQFDADVTRLAISHGAFRCALYCVLQGEIGSELGFVVANIALFVYALYLGRGAGVSLVILFILESLLPFCDQSLSERVATILIMAIRTAMLVWGTYVVYCI